jgi:hypothetical protein
MYFHLLCKRRDEPRYRSHTPTGYGLEDRGIGVRVPVETKMFTSPCRPDWLCGSPNLLANGYQGVLLPRIKWQMREANHPSPTSVQVMKTWIYTSTPHTPSWRSAKLVKHRCNVIFYLSQETLLLCLPESVPWIRRYRSDVIVTFPRLTFLKIQYHIVAADVLIMLRLGFLYECYLLPFLPHQTIFLLGFEWASWIRLYIYIAVLMLCEFCYFRYCIL